MSEQKTMNILVLDGHPISTNHYLVNTKMGRRYTPAKTRDFQKKVKEEANKIFKEPMEGDLVMGINYHFGDNRRRDVNNYDKVICDALNGIAYGDDSQIKQMVLTKFKDKENPRTEVFLEYYTDGQ
jgi:Holliday junction resolvase RusA-like endonuclease